MSRTKVALLDVDAVLQRLAPRGVASGLGQIKTSSCAS
jgi:hypothetical protein